MSFEQWQFFPCCHFLHKGDGAPWRVVYFITSKGELLKTSFSTFCLKSCLEIAVIESTQITFFTVIFPLVFKAINIYTANDAQL